MTAKKSASVTPLNRPRPATRDHLKAKTKPNGRTPLDGGVAEVIDFDAELKAADKARKPVKFRLGGYDYTLGKGPNPYQLQQIDVTEDFDVTEFIASYVIPAERKRMLEHIRSGSYGTEDFNLLQRRIMEASAGRPTAAS